MTYLLVFAGVIAYTLIVIAFTRFFRSIHEGDEQMRSMILKGKRDVVQKKRRKRSLK